MTRQFSRLMASYLVASGCDLGDERDVIRAFRKSGFTEKDISAYSDTAIDLARVIRANSSKLAVS